ncbi:MAG: BREX-1 system adenine-specific DNA-methyltransferase PglX, partial [Atopostipes sp.]|nr:BREX-1 system adenine-specific DNA-methyltransferase PglX [Atopostipes sp.]
MDKTILKNFAIYSRNKLIQEITNKAAMIGITEEVITNPLPDSTNDLLMFDIQRETPYLLKGEEIRQYDKLINELKQREENDDYETAYETLIEEIAYTWFNRLIAMRFMEVNHYMPNRLRALSSGIDVVNEPELVTNYTESGLSFTEEESQQLIDWRLDASAQAMDEMFRFLFIKQANALNENLPELFEKTDDYAELLLTISYNDPEGVLYKLIHEVPEEYFDVESDDGSGQVEIIGWLYQYYNSEKKDEVVNIINKKAIEKHNIPAATQLFTTDWVVKYMVDNSLGKYWLERNPDSPIKESLEFLMPGEVTVVDEDILPEDLTVFDNAMGSGHILSYAFDVLLKIYESKGYSPRNAAKLIVENNLYGLEIDQRAYQLSYFAIMMKARQYNRRALNGEIETNLAVFEDSTTINKEHLNLLGQKMDSKNRKKAIEQMNYLIEEFDNATELGSILVLENINKELLLEFINDSPETGQMTLTEIDIDTTQEQLRNIINISSMLSNKYNILATNPPYMN